MSFFGFFSDTPDRITCRTFNVYLFHRRPPVPGCGHTTAGSSDDAAGLSGTAPWLYPDSFCSQGESLEFLNSHHFDFNECIRSGVSYLSRPQYHAALGYARTSSLKHQEVAPLPSPLPPEHVVCTASVVFHSRAACDDPLVIVCLLYLQDELKRLFGAFKSWADEAKDGASWRVTVHGAVRRRLFTSMIRKKGGGYDRFVVTCERDGAGGRVPQCMVITKALTKKTRKAKRTQDVRGKQTGWGGASVVAY